MYERRDKAQERKKTINYSTSVYSVHIRTNYKLRDRICHVKNNWTRKKMATTPHINEWKWFIQISMTSVLFPFARSLPLPPCASSCTTCEDVASRSFDWYFSRLESMNRLVHRRWSLVLFVLLFVFTSNKIETPTLCSTETDSLLLLCSLCVSEANDGVLIAFTHLQARGKHTSFSALIVFLFAFYFEIWFFDAVCIFMPYALSVYVLLAFLRVFFVYSAHVGNILRADDGIFSFRMFFLRLFCYYLFLHLLTVVVVGISSRFLQKQRVSVFQVSQVLCSSRCVVLLLRSIFHSLFLSIFVLCVLLALVSH